MSTTPPGPDEWRRRLESLLGTPATAGNSVRILRNGVEIFPASAGDHLTDAVSRWL
jgi:hypothetical protein